MTIGDIAQLNTENAIVYCVSEQKCYEVEQVYNNGVLAIYKYANVYGVGMSERKFFSYNELSDRDYRLL